MPFAPLSSVMCLGLKLPADSLCVRLSEASSSGVSPVSSSRQRALNLIVTARGSVNVKERRVKHFLSHLQKTRIPLLGVNHGFWFFSPVIFFQV